MSDLFLNIHLDLLKHNVELLKRTIADEKVLFMAVIKSNAYGHGSVNIAKTIQNDIDYFGVSHLKEAIEIREAGIKGPILILGPTYAFEDVLKYELTLSIVSIEHYKALLEYARRHNQHFSFHLIVDTGMHRFGIRRDELKTFLSLYNQSLTQLEGVFSHFASTYKTNKKMVLQQKNEFDLFIQQLNDEGISNCIFHMANSENAIDDPTSSYDMVRIGNALFGPCNSKKQINLKKIADVNARVLAIKQVYKGEKVGYNLRQKAKKDMKLAVVAMGFYEGNGIYKRPLGFNVKELFVYYLKEMYRLVFRNKTTIYYKKQPLPIVGTPSMQYTMVQIPESIDLKVGDLVDVRTSPFFIKGSFESIYLDGGENE